MANNIDIKFSGLVELRAAKYLYEGTNGDDCLRAIHTNFYNSAYNYNGAEITSSSITDPSNAFNRNDTDFASIASGTGQFIFNNYRNIVVYNGCELIVSNWYGSCCLKAG